MLVRFVLFYFLIYRPLLRRKISLGRDGVTRTHFGGILKGLKGICDFLTFVRTHKFWLDLCFSISVSTDLYSNGKFAWNVMG